MTSDSMYPFPLSDRAMGRLEQTSTLWMPRDLETDWHAGDSLLVQESHALRDDVDAKKQPAKARHYALYRVDNPKANVDPMNWHSWGPWRPAKEMPSALCRWRLELVSCELRQLLDASEQDALAAGFQATPERRTRRGYTPPCTALEAFLGAWDGRFTQRLGHWNYIARGRAARTNPQALVWHLRLHPFDPGPLPDLTQGDTR